MTLLLSFVVLLAGQTPADLRFRGATDVVARLTPAQQKLLPAGPLTAEQGEAWLRVCTVDGKTREAGLPMLGRYERVDGELIFRPRLGFEPGRAYKAIFGPGTAPLAIIEHEFRPLHAGASATVTKIYPTADVLPANQLKFHIVFSKPMRGGQAIFQQIEILDADGAAISDAWLTDELWDADGKELILYIHPGRIKWGVVLRELLGPVLVPRRDYTLVIRGAMLDADGQPLGKDVRKKFRTTDEDRVRVALADWMIDAPKSGTRAPLTVTFRKPLDRASQRFLGVVDSAGVRVEGAGTLGQGEGSWSFVPTRPWNNGEHRLVVDGRLEDTAGNTPRRPFDLDLQAAPPPAQRLEFDFRPRP